MRVLSQTVCARATGMLNELHCQPLQVRRALPFCGEIDLVEVADEGMHTSMSHKQST